MDLTGTFEQISRAEQLISDVIAEVKAMFILVCALMFLLFHDSKSTILSKNIFVVQADAGGSAPPSTNQGFNSIQPGTEQFVMKVPNNKVDLLDIFLFR